MQRFSRMTLSRRMLVAAAVGLLGLAVLAVVSLLGIRALRLGFSQASGEFADLRHIAQAEVRLARARGLLATESPARGELLEPIDAALKSLTRLGARQEAGPLISREQREEQGELIDEARQALTTARYYVGQWKADTLEKGDLFVTTQIDRTLEATGKLASLADASMAAAQRFTRRQLEDTIASMVIVIAMVVVSALLVALWQHQGIVRPLWRLRRGVRHIAAGQFDMRLITAGDRDFAELAADFNRMTDQLEAFYKNLEDQVAAKSRELVRSERLASVGHLAAGIAHEINNPLGIIAGHAELTLKQLERTAATPDASGLADEQRLAAETLDTLRIIRDEAFRCKQIIQQLLSLSRKSPDARQRVDLARIAEGVVKMVRGHEEARDRSIELDFPAHRPLLVDANPQELKQVLLNLVVNALQATRPGAGYVDVAGFYDDATDQVVLAVEDNGRGMDAETVERVFEPFFSQHKGGDSFGLGLSVTHAIVDAHGGRITAYSAGPGKGARFSVRLPASPPESPPPGVSGPSQETADA